ncbi:RagB/SusD family nutrient uptake outer membrane protein [Desertivirga arenae]|uniref:RagB/SusD family nutrient uptake outer membrane protein n=1 Tax=Desertivirga arenae TaxID=2810309 RepID=UPI001A957100|nr:RagB/SusD family nutrient uptake outer membrane protein [Pedobacter sp. SYSU D00823]
MKKYSIKNTIVLGCILISLSFSLASCKEYVDIPISDNSIYSKDAFSTDAAATSSVLALYSSDNTRTHILNLNYLGGISSDEMVYLLQTDMGIAEFGTNTISPANGFIAGQLWQYPYGVIRIANQAIAGLNGPNSVNPTLKNQLLGECYFWRAYELFYLTNLFGGVPIPLNSNPLDNVGIPKSTVAEVYAQILKDLTTAKDLVGDAYPTTLRARVNKSAVSAFLARVYLYNKDYVNAEKEASSIISQTSVYSLPSPVTNFVNTSTEIILQQATQFGNSTIAANYRSTAPNKPVYALRNQFVNTTFEAGDTRRTNWIDEVVTGTETTYRINKYKLATASATTTGNEFNVMFRLAEQYLIRAEARAQQNNLTGANEDLTVLRARAGLGNKFAGQTFNKTALMDAIVQERKAELFGEFAHRWFDLKRLGLADAVLTPLKPGYKTDYQLYPIPASQSLQAGYEQNKGYN